MVHINLNLPDEFFEEEERSGFTISKKRKEVWAVELDLLLKFDEICKKLNIRYFLDSGTLLGAVRDGHFIPWDDDIDVIMLREDYNVLLKRGPAEFEFPYFFQNAYTDHGYFRGHSQLRNSQTCAALSSEIEKCHFNQGIFIDIFVLDGINDSIIKKQYKKRKRLLRVRSIINDTYAKKDLKHVIKKCAYYLYKNKYKDISQVYYQIENMYKHENDTEYVDKVLFRKYPDIFYLKREWFADTTNISFEGYDLPVPACYDDVLKVYYGDDYMLPRQTNSYHDTFGHFIFDTDKSYKEVLDSYRTVV